MTLFAALEALRDHDDREKLPDAIDRLGGRRKVEMHLRRKISAGFYRCHFSFASSNG
jgi:hypothetical protein